MCILHVVVPLLLLRELIWTKGQKAHDAARRLQIYVVDYIGVDFHLFNSYISLMSYKLRDGFVLRRFCNIEEICI